MPEVQLLTPLGHAVGQRRLLHELAADLGRIEFNQFKLVVAYAKAGPLLRLRQALRDFRVGGKQLSAIVGIDQNGTSREALELFLELFDQVYTTQDPRVTFHPKFYVFRGPNLARAYLGSNNLTVGGTETNFEAALRVDFHLPDDADDASQFEDAWTELLPPQCPATVPLTRVELDRLVADRTVLTETAMRQRGGRASGSTQGRPGQKSELVLRPPSPLPAGATVTLPPPPPGPGAQDAPPAPQVAVPTEGHVLHIRPHANGEIHLSRTAANQRPEFFGLPFTGLAQPKKAGNPAYPFRDPRPKVDFSVVGAEGEEIYHQEGHDLYMIYYGANGEIRITSKPVADRAPHMSIMIMQPNPRDGIDYLITVHRPDSPEYARWEAVATQVMPHGRRFGWF